MDGLIWNLLSIIIGGGVGSAGTYFFKNLATSPGTNTISGALGGLFISLLNGSQFNLVTVLATIVGSGAVPALINFVMKYIQQERV